MKTSANTLPRGAVRALDAHEIDVVSGGHRLGLLAFLLRDGVVLSQFQSYYSTRDEIGYSPGKVPVAKA